MVDMACKTSLFVFLALFGWPVQAILIPNVPAPSPSKQPQSVKTMPCTQEEMQAKDLDLVLYGATGYTGRLAAHYLVEGHPEISSWAIAGRQIMKLDYIKSRLLGSDGKNATRLETIAVGLKNVAGLYAMAKRARAIISFAGPYEKIGGDALIIAAMDGCAHYVDISTETFWKATILKKYASIAQARGVAIVQGAGFASLASDFIAMSAIEDVVKVQQEPPSHVMVVWKTLNGGVSGGQLASMQYETKFHGPLMQPYILAPNTPEDRKVDWTIDGMEEFGLFEGLGAVSRSPISSSDCPVIRRSIQTEFPGAAVSVQMVAKSSLFTEQMTFLNNQTVQRQEGAVEANPLPGKGPPGWVRNRGSFAATAIARGRWAPNPGEKVKHARVSLEGHGDPSNMGSVTMAVEVALGLATNGPQKQAGGYLTPALALGSKALEQRLTAVAGGRFVTVTHA